MVDGDGHRRLRRSPPGPYDFGINRLADELLERRLAADRVEVRVGLRKLAKIFRPSDRGAEVLDRVGGASREALVASEVVEQHRGLGINLSQLAGPVGRLGV